MAKKSTFSHVQAQQALEAVANTLNAENLPYELLRIFCDYGEASLQRIRDGKIGFLMVAKRENTGNI